jgi:hypothetical protein
VDPGISVKLLFVNHKYDRFPRVENVVVTIYDIIFLDRSKYLRCVSPEKVKYPSSLMLLLERLRDCKNNTFHFEKVLSSILILFPEKSSFIKLESNISLSCKIPSAN